MSIEIGVLLGIAGCLAALVGLASMRRSRRLRTHGVTAWAMALPNAEPSSERERHGQLLLQYTLEDGRVIERLAPSSPRRGATLEPGRKVLIWYDPADPEDVLVFGRDGRRSDWAFVTGGLLLVVAGVVVAVLSH